MTVAIVRRALALTAVTATLRGDPDALPGRPDEWSSFLELAAEHALLPAVWVAQRDHGRLAMPSLLAVRLEQFAPDGRAVPEALLRRAYDRNAYRVHRLLTRGVEVLEMLADAGIRAVPLKGLHSLLVGTWPDLAARTMVDLDVLVEVRHAVRAYELLLAHGFEEHPERTGDDADHHLPMLRDDDVTVELHTDPLISRWRSLVPGPAMLQRAVPRPTPRGELVVADATDSFVHLVAHAQLQEETHTLLGLPLRALYETAHVDARAIDWDDVRSRFARRGVAHVLDAHLDGARRLFGFDGAPDPHSGSARAAVHTSLTEAGVALPALVATWTYVVRVPRSFSAARMREEFGANVDTGPGGLWRARGRHVGRRVTARLDGDRRGARSSR